MISFGHVLLLAERGPNPEIAGNQHHSEATVKSHLGTTFTRLRMRRSEAAALAAGLPAQHQLTDEACRSGSARRLGRLHIVAGPEDCGASPVDD